MFELSDFGNKFLTKSGIGELMDDLGQALSGDDKYIMMGGGNPGHIPEVEVAMRKRMEEIMQSGRLFEDIIGNYSDPQGEKNFLKTLADFFNNLYDWNITEKNIAVTNGSQNAFFFLFNMLAGKKGDKQKKILLPVVPEYIGYVDQGIGDNIFKSNKPKIEITGKNRFKYFVDFDSIEVTDDIAAICVSRPTNPTGNVLTDEEIEKLVKLAKSNNIPLIIDNAYGAPFPNIIYKDIKQLMNANIILAFSLSKFGLPSLRTGIIVADENMISSLSSVNAVVNLTSGGLGQSLIKPLFESNQVAEISKNIITPYYKSHSQSVLKMVDKYFPQDIDYHVHESEGAFFLWIWFKNMPVTSKELYSRLKKRKVLIIPGECFFTDVEKEWKHQYECIRITYAEDLNNIEEGIKIIADELCKIYK